MVSAPVSHSVMFLDWASAAPLTGFSEGVGVLQRFVSSASGFYVALAAVLVALALVACIVERLGLERTPEPVSFALRNGAAALNPPANDNCSPVRDLPGGNTACSHAARFSAQPQPRLSRRA